jgi:hypothetical protein
MESKMIDWEDTLIKLIMPITEFDEKDVREYAEKLCQDELPDQSLEMATVKLLFRIANLMRHLAWERE